MAASGVKISVLIFGVILCLSLISATPPASRSARRNIPFLGIGPRCSGCPPHFCDDDPAIVRGYCCGCARFLDVLPVTCVPHIDCPINIYGLCENYEYMMSCCCAQ